MIYFVSTPIGNLEDITLRALNILKKVDVIACEDTRTSQKLLNRYSISKKLISFHKFNELETCEKIINLEVDGKDVAVISDAGTPLISDPGNLLTKLLNEKNIKYTVIPGANAILPALILSGLDCSSFVFTGFLPDKKSDKSKVLNELSILKMTLVFYISPHNLATDLNDIASVFGNRKCSLVKEITKIHETVYSFNLCDKIKFTDNTNDNLDNDQDNGLNIIKIDKKGEFVLVVEGCKQDDNLLLVSIPEHVKFYINLGFSKNDAIKRVASERNVKKDIVYKEVLKL
jgi:16S rRNA (cytidine1402-2'-O)-methyltransferase